MNHSQQLHTALLKEVRRRLFDESVVRLKKCLADLTELEIWHRPNTHSNSVGNLVLHLCGNVRQWVLSGIADKEDTRTRQAEFDQNQPIATEILIQMVEELMEEVEQALQNITTEELLEVKNVQGYEESVLSILIHVVEHFSYHVGQITYVVKMWKDKDMGYYAGHDLEAKN